MAKMVPSVRAVYEVFVFTFHLLVLSLLSFSPSTSETFKITERFLIKANFYLFFLTNVICTTNLLTKSMILYLLIFPYNHLKTKTCTKASVIAINATLHISLLSDIQTNTSLYPREK